MNHPLDGLGAELYPKFMQHLGYNERQLPLYPGGRKVDLTRCIGGPLSEELWEMLTCDAGCRYISVYFRDPNLDDLAYHDALMQSHKRCVILVTEDGYVTNIFRDMWTRPSVSISAQEHVTRER